MQKRKLGNSNLEVSAIGQAGKGRGMKEELRNRDVFMPFDR
jgi:hypothetical protein